MKIKIPYTERMASYNTDNAIMMATFELVLFYVKSGGYSKVLWESPVKGDMEHTFYLQGLKVQFEKWAEWWPKYCKYIEKGLDDLEDLREEYNKFVNSGAINYMSF